MFVKKLVEKASKKPGRNLDSLSSDEVNPRLVFHYGIPAGSILLAYDPIQKILAISTEDGRIKFLGKLNAQALLESNDAVASKYLQFVENQGILLNINVKNHIQVWDIEKKLLSFVYVFKGEITSFTVMQHSPFMYLGDTLGNISVLRLDQDLCQIVTMKYNIPLSASRGKVAGDTVVTNILVQPMAESKRILIIFRDGLMTLWAIQTSKPIFMAGGSVLPSSGHEAKKVTSACWACPFGTKVVVGYSNGEIFIWSVSPNSHSNSESAIDKDFCAAQNTPIFKLNLGYKLDKIPIALLKWIYADGKASRLYIMGAADSSRSNMVQIILMNEQSESRTIKLTLQPPEVCVDIGIISSSGEQGKHKQDSFLILGKSGRIYACDENSIEKYLLQCHSRLSPASIPNVVMLKLPFVDSNITIAKFMTDNSSSFCSAGKDYALLIKNIRPLLPVDLKEKGGVHFNPGNFGGFATVKNLYITGHCNGAIYFWDVSYPTLLPVLSLKQQSEDDISLSGVALTALYFDSDQRVLVSGDRNGMVRTYKFKPESFGVETSFMSIQGSTKKGSNHIIKTLKLIKFDGTVTSLNMNHSSGRLAVGTDLGYVSLIDIEGNSKIYETHIPSDLCAGIISLQFETCSFRGFEKNVLLVAARDSSILALDADTGNSLSTNTIHPKKSSKSLLMQVLDGQQMKRSDGLNADKMDSSEEIMPKQSLLLLCSEQAAYVYSLTQAVQGVKKVHYKKKFNSSFCSWASTFYTKSCAGLLLLFTSGKFEIRSLPDLSLVKESSIRGFMGPKLKQNPFSHISICCSWNGELIVVNGDQEVFFVSVLSPNDTYRFSNFMCEVYDKDLKLSQEGPILTATIPKGKKKGFLSSVIKDMRSAKTNHGPEMGSEDTRGSLEELSTIFSDANFPVDDNTGDDDELDIDDIDLEDSVENYSRRHNFGSKQKLTSKFQALKGKLKQKVENEKGSGKGGREEQKCVGAVDEIKKKYGFPLSGESSAAKMAGSKLSDNLMKLQGINLKTEKMQDTAQSFSSMATEVLRSAEEQGRQSS